MVYWENDEWKKPANIKIRVVFIHAQCTSYQILEPLSQSPNWGNQECQRNRSKNKRRDGKNVLFSSILSSLTSRWTRWKYEIVGKTSLAHKYPHKNAFEFYIRNIRWHFSVWFFFPLFESMMQQWISLKKSIFFLGNSWKYKYKNGKSPWKLVILFHIQHRFDIRIPKPIRMHIVHRVTG